jgi:hypothetical protein
MSLVQNQSWTRSYRERILRNGPFGYLRRAVWIFLAMDILATILFISISSAPSRDIQVWLETGVPSNFIMVKTFSETKLKAVEVILDGQYFFTKDELAPGTSGLRIENEFLTVDETLPVDGYRPKHVELRIGDERYRFTLGHSKK